MSNFECGICISEIKNEKQKYITSCAHKFCVDCFCEWKNISKNKLTCPMCRTDLKADIENISPLDITQFIIQNLNTFSADFYKKYQKEIKSASLDPRFH
jgi:hypothetical protein